MPIRTRPAVALVAVLASAAVASADPIATATFTFDNLSHGAGNAAVQTYLQNGLSAAGLGTVMVKNALAQTNYMADNFIVGPVVNGQVVPRTLGYPTPGDAYLVNDGNGATGDRITMEFSFPISQVSFDFQIFPSAGWETNTPDFSLWADGVMVYRKFGVVPGQDGTFLHSIRTGPNANEVVPQFLGSYSHTFGGAGVTRLEFRDWPVRIGIDNLTLIPVSSPQGEIIQPEPGSIAVAIALVGAAGLGWRRRRQAAAA